MSSRRSWLGAELGAMRGEGVALYDAHTGTGTWVVALAGTGVGVPVMERVQLRASVEVGVPLARPRFALESGDELYRPAAVTGRGSLGVEIRWQ